MDLFLASLQKYPAGPYNAGEDQVDWSGRWGFWGGVKMNYPPSASLARCHGEWLIKKDNRTVCFMMIELVLKSNLTGTGFAILRIEFTPGLSTSEASAHRVVPVSNSRR